MTKRRTMYTVQSQTRTLPSPFFRSEGDFRLHCAGAVQCTVYSCIPYPDSALTTWDGMGSSPDRQDADQGRTTSLRPLVVILPVQYFRRCSTHPNTCRHKYLTPLTLLLSILSDKDECLPSVFFITSTTRSCTFFQMAVPRLSSMWL